MADDPSIARDPTELASSSRGSGRERRLVTGERAGDYEVVRHLGAGAMGDVYEGVQRAIGKRVAIKVIKYALADSEEAAERFVREARAVNQIDHPNVLDVFAFGHLDDGRPYLVMDLLEGCSLGDLLRERGPLEREDFLEIFDGVCRALDAAHARGVIHRDLKPDNVFLAEAGGERRIYVLDFGIAKLLSDAAADSGGTLTGEGVWIGTPAYMAPEQWTADGATVRSDVYALGVMAYEMLSGRAPYRADSVPAVMEKHFHAEVPVLEAKEGRAPPPRAVSDAVREAMAKKPEDRFGSAGALGAAVRGAFTAGGKETRRAPRVPGAALLLGGALGLGVLAMAAVLLFGDHLSADRTADQPPPAPSPPATDRSQQEMEDEPVLADQVALKLEVVPAGTRIVVNGEDRGVSRPAAVLDARAGETLEVRLSHPGFVGRTLRLEVTADKPARRIELDRGDGFAGTWTLPDGALRHLERDGDEVVVDAVDPRTGARQPFQRYRFIDAPEGAVVFETSSTVVEPSAPDGDGCRRALRTQYRYWPADQRLELRNERDQVVVRDGACESLARSFRPWSVLERHWSAEAPRGGPVKSPTKNTDRTLSKKPLQKGKRAPTTGARSAPRAKTKSPPPAQQNAPSPKQPPAQQQASPPAGR